MRTSNPCPHHPPEQRDVHDHTATSMYTRMYMYRRITDQLRRGCSLSYPCFEHDSILQCSEQPLFPLPLHLLSTVVPPLVEAPGRVLQDALLPPAQAPVMSKQHIISKLASRLRG